MIAAIIALVTALAVPLNAFLPPNAETVDAAESTTPAPSRILDTAAGEVTQPDGRHVRWTSVTHELSTGQEAEAFVEVDDRGRGDVLIYVDGDVIMHVSTDGQSDTTWIAPDLGLPPEAIAELVSTDVATQVFAGIGPQAFKCSEFGKKP
jgi:hypothetical protein